MHEAAWIDLFEMAMLSGSWFAQDPGGHAAAVLDDGGFEWVDELGVTVAGEREEHWFVDEKPIGVADAVEAAGERFEVHADARAKTAEEQAAGLKNAPEFVDHCVEVFRGTCEVKNRAADDHIGDGVGKRNLLDRSYAEVFFRRWIFE